MSLNVLTITPASLKAKQVATESYVDSAVGNVSISDETWQAKVQEAINNNTTTINGSHIVTGSIAADKIAANSISTGQLAVGTGIVNGYLQSSDFTAVGGTGFRLKSGAAGTSVDPTIYGGYIKGGTIDGATLIGGVLSVSDFKVKAQTYPANTGRFQLEFETVTKGASTVDSPVFIGQAASPGHSLSRMCLDSQIFRYYASCDAFFTTNTTAVYVSINGGAWTTVATSSSTQGSGVAGEYVHTNTGTATVQFRFITSSGDNMSHAVNRFRLVSDNFV